MSFSNRVSPDKRTKAIQFWPNLLDSATQILCMPLFMGDITTQDDNTVTDIDGNVYATIQIGDQNWMKENLKTTRYADGTAIPLVTGNTQWNELGYTDKAYCWYDNSTTNRDIYGALYTWSAATNGLTSDLNPSGIQGACPYGWHLPSDAEWKQLENFLGMDMSELDMKDAYRGTNEGGKLKEAGTTHWDSGNNGTNESGFTALPGGYRNNSDFLYKGTKVYFLNASEEGASWTIHRELTTGSGTIGRYGELKNRGMSIRCVKD